ncbi:MAG: BrnA antitoxin family protein [Mariprofundales bacterium]
MANSKRIADTTDWNAIDHLTDHDIAAAVARDSDAAPLDSNGLRMVKRGRPRADNPKQAISIRLSPEVVTYFRATGKGWQTRIDAVLKDFVSHA